MSLRQRARDLWEDAQEYVEDRPERVAARRAAFWSLYGRYTAVREEMTKDQQTMRRISSAIGKIHPVAGAIAYAAMNVDKYIAPAQSRLAGSEETIALLMIEELENDGTLTTREARKLAKETLEALEEAKNGATNGNGNGTGPLNRRPRGRPRGMNRPRGPVRIPGPGPSSTIPGTVPAVSGTEPEATEPPFPLIWLAVPAALLLLTRN